jgi:hypothetical protein
MRLLVVPTLGLLTAAPVGCVSIADLTYPFPDDPAVGADVGATCPPGRYVTRPPRSEGPYWLWDGPDGQEPHCPPEPQTGGWAWDGHADLVTSDECPCTCELSTGACELPSMLTASAMACNIAEAAGLSFNAPVPWDGKCDNTIQVPAMAANSLWIAPMTIKQDSCEPGLRVPPIEFPHVWDLPYSWKRIGRICHGWGWSWSQNPETICIPDGQPAPKDFRLCIMKEDDILTPCDPAWPDRRVFYDGLDDTRDCKACKCGPPTGSLCTATISIHKDSTCTAPVGQGIDISSTEPACGDLSPPGPALVSKSATPPVYVPGTCEPSHITATGTASPKGPVTFCCQY